MTPERHRPVLLRLAWAAAHAGAILFMSPAALGDASGEPVSTATCGSEIVAAFSLGDEEACHDLGYVEVKAVRSFQLSVRNSSSETLRISAIRSECSCMTAAAATEKVPAEGEMTLAVEFHAPRRASHYAKRLVLLLEGGRPMKFPILIEARVGLPLTIEPKTLDLGTLIAGEIRRRNVVIHNDGPTPVRPVYATASGAGCHAAVPRAEAPTGGSLAIPIVLQTSQQATGPGKVNVAIHTDCPEQGQVQVTVRYEVSPAYRLSQGQVRLGSVGPGERVSCRFEITAADPEARDFVRSCRLTELDNLSGEPTVSHKENRATVTCDLIAGERAASLGGKLRLTLENHPQPVEVLIDGLVRAAGPEGTNQAAISTDAASVPRE